MGRKAGGRGEGGGVGGAAEVMVGWGQGVIF